MARYERMGAAVLAVNQVKGARVLEDAEPALRLLLRATQGPAEGVRVWTQRVDAGICLDGRSGRLGRAVARYKVKVEGGE